MTKNTKTGLVLMMLALCLANFATMGDSIIIPIGDALYKFFGDQNAVSYILSGPALISAVVSAFGGKITEKIGAKAFLCIGFGVFTVASCLTIFATQSIVLLIICRTLMGIGMGALGVGALVVISEHFDDEKKRSSMIGINNAASNVAGAALGAIAGVVAQAAWQNVFYIYLVSIPIFILLLLFIPAEKKEAGAAEADAASSAGGEMPWGIMVRIALAFLAFNVMYMVLYYQISVVMVGKGIENTALIGTMLSLTIVGSCIACATFGLYFLKTKRYTITMAYAVMAIGFVILYFTSSVPLIMVLCVVLGGFYGLGFSYFLSYATMIVPSEKVPTASAIVMFINGLGMFLASYFPYWLMAIMGTEDIIATLPVIAVFFAVGTVLSLIFAKKETKYFENA